MDCSSNTSDIKTMLEKDGFIVQMPFGISMYPMLKQKKDSVVIKKISEKPRENDVVLFQAVTGKYLLHRVIKVNENDYTIRGDNNLQHEYGVKDEQILGILIGFYKGEKYIDCNNNKLYKIYYHLNRRTYYIRALYKLCRLFLSKVKHKFFK